MSADIQCDVLPRAVAKLAMSVQGSSKPQEGTAFLISPTRAITCAHCVKNLAHLDDPWVAESVTLNFTQAGGEPVRARVLSHVFAPRDGIDVAVLGLEAPSRAAVLPVGLVEGLTVDEEWRSFAHPTIVAEPQWLVGKAPGVLTRGNGHVLVLKLPEARERLRGASGAPVVCAGRVVGIVSEQLLKLGANGGAEPAFDTAYGVELKRALELDAVLQTLRTREVVFISYKRDTIEAKLAAELQTALRRLGHEVFMDIDMPVGTKWVAKLEERLAECTVFIPILSDESITSTMVAREVRIAYRRRRRSGVPVILPVRVASKKPLPYELNLYLGSLHYAYWGAPADTEDVLTAIGHAVDLGAIETNGSALPPAVKGASPAQAAVDLRYAFPRGGAVPLTDPCYVRRSQDLEAEEVARLNGDGFTIFAPSQYGKSSLLVRYLDACRKNDKHTITVDFRGFGDLPNDYLSFLTDLRHFLRLTCDLPEPAGPIRLDVDFGFFMESLLRKQPRLVLAFDNVDRVIARPYSNQFLSTLRSYMDRRAESAIWENLDLALVVSSEPASLIVDPLRSPFNIGRVLLLEPFTIDDYRRFSELLGCNLTEPDVQLLHELVGGHPYLTRIAFAELATKKRSFAVLDQQATDANGPFGPVLRAFLARISRTDGLLQIVKRIIQGQRVTDSLALTRLGALGLIRSNDGGANHEPANVLFARFFADLR